MRISDWSADGGNADQCLPGRPVSPQAPGCAPGFPDSSAEALPEVKCRQAGASATRAPGGAGRVLAQHSSLCAGVKGTGRSEEHTSELQSLMRISYAVFCLKQKKTN